ncbi:MAG: Fe-S cluster assembly protein SufD [Pseudomonadota bacterium]
MSREAIDYVLSDFESLSKSDKTDWFGKHRRSAIDAFKQNGYPTTRQEDWKYTDVKQIARQSFSASQIGNANLSTEELNQIRFNELNCIELVFLNGVYSTDLSNLDKLPKEVVICDLATAFSEHRELLEATLQKSESANGAFTALNTAFIQHGVLIYIPQNVKLEQPVNLLFIAKQQDQSFAAHLRNIVMMEDNSELTLIESFIGLDDAQYFTNVVTDVELHQNARLEHYKLQQESMHAYHVGNFRVTQKKDSYLETHSIALGAALARSDIHSQLDDNGATIVMNGLYMPGNRQHVDNHTRVDHLKPHTYSTENYRGVLSDRSRAVFNGKVIVHKDAQKIEAHQNNANLLLSDDAEIDTKPELEIYADDVKCSHGATIGQLDKDMLFYLRSRAIDEETARSLLTFAFAEEVISKIGLTAIRNRLEYLVVGQLPDADLIREFTNE